MSFSNVGKFETSFGLRGESPLENASSPEEYEINISLQAYTFWGTTIMDDLLFEFEDQILRLSNRQDKSKDIIL